MKGKLKMKTKIIYSSLLMVIFLFTFSSCNKNRIAESSTGSAGKVFSTDSVYSDEYIINENLLFNNAQGRTVGSNMENAYEHITGENMDDNYTYEEEKILNENPFSEDVSLDAFESSLASDGKFVSVTQDEIDPDNNVSGETVNCDEDLYVNVIWIPNSNYVYANWNPYTNGRWVLTKYGWTWKSFYRWKSTYHYGRWWYSHRYGWVWSPGRRWAPAWVIWGHHKHYIGWHPISPRIHIHKKGPVTPIIPRKNQNGWVIVKKSDFTKTINISNVIPDNKKITILKNTSTTITLKQENNTFYNENTKIYSKPKIQVKPDEPKTVKQIITKKNTYDENTSPVSNNKQKNITPVSSTNKQNSTAPVNNKTAVVTKTTEKESVNKNKDVNNNKTVTPVTGNKQVNVSNTNSKNNTVEPKKNENVTQKKVTENKKTVTTSSTNVNKQNNNENKSIINDLQKKNIEHKPINTEKNKNNSIAPNNNTRTNNTSNTVKTETPNRTSEKNVNKNENTNKNVNPAPKIQQSPKVNNEPVKNSPPKNENKKGNN